MSKALLIVPPVEELQGNRDAAKFYIDVLNYLSKKGVETKIHPVQKFTQPEEADLWISHSTAKSELLKAPPATKVLALCAMPAPGIPAVYHQSDNRAKASDMYRVIPNQYHYLFNDEMKYALDKLIERRPIRSLPQKAASAAAKDLELWHTWKKDPKPEHLSSLLTALEPVIIGEANKWRQSGIDEEILNNHARILAYESLHNYDPGKSQLNTHVTNNLKKMSRFTLQHQNALWVPEEKTYDYRKFMNARAELETQLGRVPTMEELQSHVGVGTKLSDFKPMIEHHYSKASEAGATPVMEELTSDAATMQVAYQSLNPQQQTIFKHTYGYQGAPVLGNTEIAALLAGPSGKPSSDAAISKQKRVIERKVRDHIDAGRFLLNSG